MKSRMQEEEKIGEETSFVLGKHFEEKAGGMLDSRKNCFSKVTVLRREVLAVAYLAL